jgi:hypothetical protein
MTVIAVVGPACVNLPIKAWLRRLAGKTGRCCRRAPADGHSEDAIDKPTERSSRHRSEIDNIPKSLGASCCLADCVSITGGVPQIAADLLQCSSRQSFAMNCRWPASRLRPIPSLKAHRTIALQSTI